VEEKGEIFFGRIVKDLFFLSFFCGGRGLEKRSLTVFQSSPSCDHGHAPREVVFVIWHTNGHDVLVVTDGRLELQQGYVVLERRSVLLPVDDDAFHVLADAPFGLDLATDVVLAEHGHQVRQKSADNQKRQKLIII